MLAGGDKLVIDALDAGALYATSTLDPDFTGKYFLVKFSSFFGVTCSNLSLCLSVKSLLTGFVFSALSGDFSCCSVDGLHG